MKKNKKWTIAILVVLSVLVLVCGGLAIGVHYVEAERAAREEEEANTMVSFAEWFDFYQCELVPAMVVEGAGVGNATDYGSGNYLIDINGTTPDDYYDYLKVLEENGFTKFVDNGEGFDNGAVLSATYTSEDVVLTVTHIKNIDKTYISVNDELPLSSHLLYDESYVASDREGAQTTLSLLEQFEVGNSFVIQLKNGHFIISDGGEKEMLPYFLDYLEGLTPEGEKPVVEGWFISHPHTDHMGLMKGFLEHQEYADRLYVEGVYYNTPGANINSKDGGAATNSGDIETASYVLRTSEGYSPFIYRVQTGQRYYFDDITIDIAFTQEQIIPDSYTADINEGSTWCMVTIEGQTILMVGDADKGAMKNVMRMYSPEYLSVDILTSFHHSVNTWDTYTDYAKVGTVLVTRYGMNMNYESNHYLQTVVDEILSYVDGTKVLTFPYIKGTAKSLPNLEWKYHTPEQIKARVIVK